MATIKKIKKAGKGCGPGDNSCGIGPDRVERRYARQAKREAGERLDQKIMRGLGLATLDKQSERQSARSERINERKENRQFRRDNTPDMPAFRMQFKSGGKMKKAASAKKATVKKAIKPSMKKGGKITKSSKKK